MKNNSFETVATRPPLNLRVIGIDIRADVVDTINGRRIHIFEPELEAAYRKMSQVHNPYVDGRGAQRIAEIVSQFR